MGRLLPDDTVRSSIIKMSEGIPGCTVALMALYEANDDIDPDTAHGGGIIKILQLDDLGIYGSNVWVLYKDVCKHDVARLIALLRGYQMGFVKPNDLREASVRGRGHGINTDQVWDNVCTALPKFRKRTSSAVEKAFQFE